MEHEASDFTQTAGVGTTITVLRWLAADGQ